MGWWRYARRHVKYMNAPIEMDTTFSDGSQSGPVAPQTPASNEDGGGISGLLDGKPQKPFQVPKNTDIPTRPPDVKQQPSVPMQEDPNDDPSLQESVPEDENLPDYETPDISDGGNLDVEYREDPNDGESLDSFPDGPVNFHPNCHCFIQRMPGGRRRWKTGDGCCDTCEQASRVFNAFQDFKKPMA